MADVVITRYRTGFRLQTTDAYLRNALTALHETLTRPKIERSRGRVYAVPGDKFYIESVKESAYYYIDALYDQVIQFIRNTQLRRNYPEYTVDVTVVTPHEGSPVVFDRHSLKIKEPDDSDFVYQNGIVDYASEAGRKHTILELQTGKGKALADYTPVKTPEGWTPIGDLSVGDLVVAKDGSATEVTGVYPQGEVQLYRINFADGRWVECCAEHQWKVYAARFGTFTSSVILDTSMLLRMPPDVLEDVYIDLYTPDVTTEMQVSEQLQILLADGDITCDAANSTYIANDHITATVVMELVRSVGGLANLVDECTVQVQYPSVNKTLMLGISSIVPVTNGNATCISVAHPEALFVCKDYVVTHNTKLSMKVANQKGKRILVITKAAYVSKWLGDLSEDLNLRKGELIKIDGADGLQDMIEIGKTGRLDATSKSDQQIKAMVISSHALDKYIDNFLKYDGVETHPSDILRHLDVGFVIYDETHQLFRMNYWSYLIMNAPDVIDLSATLVPDDTFLKARYMERLPGPSRYDKLEFDKYIDAIGIMYGIDDDKLTRSVNAMSLYNHMAFEGKLLKSKKMQKNYFAMCDAVLGKFYFKDYQPGQKALIFFSTQQMCTEFAEYMQKLHPTQVVKRYIQGDKYEDMQKGDIIVSTPGKSGTAVDIKGLVISLSTVMIDDTQANLQMLGRTRKTKQWDIDVRMVYMFCRSIRKHMRYHEKRMKMYKGKVKSHMILNSSFMI